MYYVLGREAYTNALVSEGPFETLEEAERVRDVRSGVVVQPVGEHPEYASILDNKTEQQLG